jgi:hypothetical protein
MLQGHCCKIAITLIEPWPGILSAMICLQQVEMWHLRNGVVRSLQRLFLSNNFVCVVKQQAELL